MRNVTGITLALLICMPLAAAAEGITSVTSAESSSGGNYAPVGASVVGGSESASAHSTVRMGQGSTTYRVEVRTEENGDVHTQTIENTAPVNERVEVRVGTTNGEVRAQANVETGRSAEARGGFSVWLVRIFGQSTTTSAAAEATVTPQGTNPLGGFFTSFWGRIRSFLGFL